MTLNWNPRFSNFFSICEVMLSKPTWLLGYTVGEGVLTVAIVGEGKLQNAMSDEGAGG